MERLKNLKMLLTILFIAAAGSLFLYDGKRTSDIQWQTAADDADLQQLNLADQLTDGQRIYVPAEGETAADPEYTEDEVSNGLVNINTATAEQLQTLPGIGQAKANAIVAYRENNGNFSSIEDLRKVPGIKEGVFGQIQSLICVN